MILACFIGAVVLGALLHFAGWAKPVLAVTEFLSRNIARALLVGLVVLGWYVWSHW